jgi:hypothetical protein
MYIKINKKNKKLVNVKSGFRRVTPQENELYSNFLNLGVKSA